jgi:hypothetical protein
MPRYFFDVHANGNVAPDEEGMILPNIDGARKEASRALGDLARDTIHRESSRSLVIKVRRLMSPVGPFETCPSVRRLSAYRVPGETGSTRRTGKSALLTQL